MNKSIGILTLSNWGGIAILEINDRDEEVTIQWYDNEPEILPYEYGYDEELDEFQAFFIIGDTKYCFHEFMVV